MELALTSKVQLYLTSAQVTLFQQITGGYRHVYKWVSTIAAATFCLQQAAPPFRDLPSLAGADGLTMQNGAIGDQEDDCPLQECGANGLLRTHVRTPFTIQRWSL
ncbi:MAG: hypothetical protein M1318_03520 [Firmicutes bacterium]|jgi:hypothetical protein|nr:hypothetical protein [Bacillota bacterium]